MKTTKYLIIYMLLACVALYGCQEIEEPINNIPTVTTYDVEKVGTTTAHLTGEISEKNFVRGKFLLSTTEDFTDYIEVDASAKGMQFYADIEGLATGTTYYCVLSVTDGCSEVKGEVVKFTTNQITEGDYVDLGLPSGTLWASCNVGANSPEEVGGYYAWGETEEKEVYSWETYKWCDGDYTSITKYCTSSDYGSVDNKTVLDFKDDVASVILGHNWRIPTMAEMQELIENCMWTWGEYNGMKGMFARANNGNCIFFPATGCKVDTGLSNFASHGTYATSSLNEKVSSFMYEFVFNENSTGIGGNGRSGGRSIRPVYDEIQVTEGDYVDLGLPSGTLWASCNVGANTPEEVGGYYAWGEIEEKNDYRADNYTGGRNSYNTDILDLKDDVAHVKLGKDWRMPTVTEAQELIKECNWVRGIYKNMVGCYVISKNNRNCIFLPSGGYKVGKDDWGISNEGYGHYWTSSEYEHVSNEWAYALNAPDFSGEHLNPYAVDDKYRCWGLPVRPVMDSSSSQDLVALKTFTVNGVTFNMIGVGKGTFNMGSSDEQPVHSVTLTKSYYVGETEVTQELYKAVMGTNPSAYSGDQRPVEYVSWNDCQTFITKLNELTGQTFRLPTEAEWEFAARGGNESKGYTYSGSNTVGDVACYMGNYSSGHNVVKSKSPNELGIYDMSGNVWEWCQDWYGSYSSGSQTDPTGPTSGSNRVLRGGSWGYAAACCRVAYRVGFTPTHVFYHNGFRLALSSSH